MTHFDFFHAAELPVPAVTVDPRLIEISFGLYEGRLHTELASGAMAIAGERDESFWNFRPPQGESYADLAERVADFGRSLSGPSIVVAHGGILRVLRRLIEDFPLERTVNWFPPQDSVVHFIDNKAIVYPAGQSWDFCPALSGVSCWLCEPASLGSRFTGEAGIWKPECQTSRLHDGPSRSR